MTVSAIIVTRGDVDLAPIIGQDWPDAVDEIVVWDNSKDEDLAVYGRYAAIEKAKNPLIYVQDDDVVLPHGSIAAIILEWIGKARNGYFGPGAHDPDPILVDQLEPFVVCNMPARFRDQPQYERGDQALVGFGACFHRDAPERAWAKINKDPITRVMIPRPFGEMGYSPLFTRTCDIVFTGLTPRVLVDVPYEDLPHAHAENRMWKQPQHVEERMGMLELVRQVRAG